MTPGITLIFLFFSKKSYVWSLLDKKSIEELKSDLNPFGGFICDKLIKDSKLKLNKFWIIITAYYSNMIQTPFADQLIAAYVCDKLKTPSENLSYEIKELYNQDNESFWYQ